MSEQQHQHLSALVDGEIDPALLDVTVSAIESSTELETCWERYHLIGSALRSETIREEYRQIAARVRDRIDGEPIPITRPPASSESRPSRLGPFAGAALAASAAFFAVFAVPELFDPEPGSKSPSVAQSTATSPAQFQLARSGQRWHLDQPALESKLDRFLMNHQELSTASSIKGFLPYATFVGYEARR
jgi:sigma-E factor negative regulatory protein RseA